MSNNLTIPAAVWACKVDGVPLVAGIVDGEECCPFFRSGQHEYQSHRRQMRPPADLVALRDARCERCDEGCDIYWCCVGHRGGGTVVDWDYLCDRHRDHQGFHDCSGCCPRCVDGRLLVDLRVECATCEGTGDDPPSHVEADHHGPCRTCETPTRVHPGYRTVKGLVDVVPVVERHPFGPFTHTDGYALHLYGGGLQLWQASGVPDGTTLTPAHVEALGVPTPGSWAVLFTEVK